MLEKRPTFRIPVKFVDGRWEFFYGGAVPAKEGAIGDLLLEDYAIVDKDFLKTLSAIHEEKIFCQGKILKVALSIRGDLAGEYETLLQELKFKEVADWGRLEPGTTRFATIHVGPPSPAQIESGRTEGGVWLVIRGLEAKGLRTSQIIVPEVISKEPLSSPNHAFTKLSEVFEPWRISHTGNIYRRIFYQERDGRWCPLEYLRDRSLVKAERSIAADLWNRVADHLGLARIHRGNNSPLRLWKRPILWS